MDDRPRGSLVTAFYMIDIDRAASVRSCDGIGHLALSVPDMTAAEAQWDALNFALVF